MGITQTFISIFQSRRRLFIRAVTHAVFLFALFAASSVSAASLYFSPSAGSYTTGQTVTVTVYTGSQGTAMNAVSGVISFPADTVEVLSLSKTGSIVDLWVQEPSFSNSSGVISFEGIALNPGYTGSAGKILSATIRFRSSGAAPLTFSSGSVLANDGQGTNILDSLGEATFTIGDGIAPAPKPSVPASAPASPVITSETHSDQTAWYSNDVGVFRWNVPSGVTGTRLLLDDKPQSTPTVQYVPPISEKTIKNLDEGTQYLHAQLRNDAGWGAAAHFQINVDTEAPESFIVSMKERTDITDPKITLDISAADSTSGIDRYEILIDGVIADTLSGGGKKRYETNALSAGAHMINITVFDKAGNLVSKEVPIEVEALAPPEFTDYPETLTSGESFEIKGETYPNAEVTVWIGEDGRAIESHVTVSNEHGVFALEIQKGFSRGKYVFWGAVKDIRGATSEPSEPIAFSVSWPSLGLTDGQATSTLVFLALIIIAWYARSTFILLKRRIHQESDEAKTALHKAFDLLRNEVENHVETLERKQKKKVATKEEEKVLRRFKKNLKEAEKYIAEEMKDIDDLLG